VTYIWSFLVTLDGTLNHLDCNLCDGPEWSKSSLSKQVKQDWYIICKFIQIKFLSYSGCKKMVLLRIIQGMILGTALPCQWRHFYISPEHSEISAQKHNIVSGLCKTAKLNKQVTQKQSESVTSAILLGTTADGARAERDISHVYWGLPSLGSALGHLTCKWADLSVQECRIISRNSPWPLM
jgi:hypothetical protein